MLYINISQAQTLLDELKIPQRHQQVVLVIAENWNSPTGVLQLYHRNDTGWILTGKKTEIVLGKNGLGWGRGLHSSSFPGPEKVEGDGKAPAGIFEFGEAFGYDKTPPLGVKLPYRQSIERDYWVDAINSAEYNSWVTIPDDKDNDPKKYWSSIERMKRRDHLYELGVVVKHNMDPAIVAKGSAIFLHVWRTSGSFTLGCTAMSKENLTSILAWLEPEKKPILIQIPRKEISQLKWH